MPGIRPSDHRWRTARGRGVRPTLRDLLGALAPLIHASRQAIAKEKKKYGRANEIRERANRRRGMSRLLDLFRRVPASAPDCTVLQRMRARVLRRGTRKLFPWDRQVYRLRIAEGRSSTLAPWPFRNESERKRGRSADYCGARAALPLRSRTPRGYQPDIDSRTEPSTPCCSLPLRNLAACRRWGCGSRQLFSRAASSIEALLLDVCMVREGDSSTKWGERWAEKANVASMVRFAAEQGWIAGDQRDLANLLRRWRNLIPPHRILQEPKLPKTLLLPS